LRYSLRAEAAGSTPGSYTRETVDAAASMGQSSSIALDSSEIPGIVYYDAGNERARYAHRAGGSWSVTEDLGDSDTLPPSGGRALAFDSADVPVAILDQSLPAADGRLRYWKDSSGTWSSAVIDETGFTTLYSAMVIDSDDYVHIAYLHGPTASMKYAVGILRDYHYKLTAEYDDGVLGESGPSAATLVALTDPISAGATHTLQLDAGVVYNMTDDVTKIHIYRTTRGTKSDSRYYRAGSVSTTGGTLGEPVDFVDNIRDSVLISDSDTYPLLDEDVFLPPKYRYGVWWKDRAVIAYTKARDTGDTAALDVGDTADASIHKNRLRFSRGFKPDLFPQNFFQDIVPDGHSGSITGLIIHEALDRLFVFMENDVIALEAQLGDALLSESFIPRNVANTMGTPAPKSIVYANGFIFYWTKTGIEVIDGFRGRNITSETVAPLWRWTATDEGVVSWWLDRISMGSINKVAGVFDEKEQRIYWSYPSATSTDNDHVLVLDVKLWMDGGMGDGVFSIWIGSTLVMELSTWCRFDGEGDQGEIFAGGEDNGEIVVYRVPYRYEDNLSNSGADINAINVDLRLGLTAAGRPDLLKSWRAMTARGRGATADTLAVDYYLDEGSAVTLASTFDFSGTAVKRLNSAFPRAAIGTSMGIGFQTADTLSSSQGPNPGFELYSVGLEFSGKKTRVRPHLAP